MTKPTIGLGIICRNSEVSILRKALDSVKDHVDRIYITVADPLPPSDEIKVYAATLDAVLTHFPWNNTYDSPEFDMDFAAARNFNMKDCKEDWYTWIDSDDTVEGMENARDFLMQLPPTVKCVLATYNYAFFPSGKVENAHPKERFMKMGEGFTWKGALHENCILPHKGDVMKCETVVWNHHTTQERSLDSCLRNIKIVERELATQIAAQEANKDNKVDPRTVFNLGMAYCSFAQKTDKAEDWEEAIKAFQGYIKMSGWDTHAYVAFRFMGEAHMRLGRPHLALNCYLECLKLHPEFKDGYALMGSAYLGLQDKSRAKAWFKLALLAGEDNAYVTDLRASLVMPLLSLAEIYATEGKLDDAEKFLVFCLEETKIEDPNVIAMLTHIRETKAWLTETETERKRLEALPAEEQRAAFDALSAKMKSSPQMVMFRRSKKWKTTTSGKEVVIHTGVGWEEWTPDNEKTGIGGSEEAVINMGRELVKRGFEVTVFGNHGFEAKTYEGVTYKPYWEWSPEEPTDIFIGWRDPTLFDIEIVATKKFLWLHDTNPESSLTAPRLAKMDGIFVLSKYHRSLYPNVPDEKFILSANGINPEQFPDGLGKKDGKAMYVSAPNRGLLTLLKLWPRIKEKVPHAELYWAYGWETYDIMMRTNPLARAYKEECLKAMEGLQGFYDLGRIGHADLARHMSEAVAWLYPTEFTEIFCISAVKAQAAGMVPVTTNVAALDETVQFGTKLDVADISANPEAMDAFVDAAVEALTKPHERRDEMIAWAKSEWSWGCVADQWSKLFSA